MKSNENKKAVLILILGALTALSPFSIDMYLPAFQKMATAFETGVADAARVDYLSS